MNKQGELEMNELTKKIGVILLLILAAFILMNTSILADSQRVIKENSFKMKQGETLYVDAAGADIKVKSWDKDEALIKIFGNRKAEEKMKFEIEKIENGIRVIAKKKGFSFFDFGSGISVKIEAYLPVKSNSEIETSGGNIEIIDLNGSIELNTSGGDIKLQNTSGKVHAVTSGGDIVLLNQAGSSDITTSGGNIQCKNISGDLNASTSGGNIEIESKNGKISAKTSGGDIKIALDGAFQGIYASTSGGDIQLYLPSNTNASVELETSGGEIECNFSNSKSTKVTHNKFIADFNNGGEKLIAKSSGGDISVFEK